MSNSKTKGSRKRWSVKRRILVVALCALCIFGAVIGIFFAYSSSRSRAPEVNLDNTRTTRLVVPVDGSTPLAHTGEENIAYLAYVLDNQFSYHVESSNVSVGSSLGVAVTQKTFTWKDFKGSAASGVKGGVMVASDITYSTSGFGKKASTQACFVNDEAYFRNANSAPNEPPATNSTNADWYTGEPTFYTHSDYRKVYGEFGTEITVFILNSSTIDSVSEVEQNADGTYSLSATLKPNEAAYWYRYGMKTRGGATKLPNFKNINISFKFDKNWQVLETVAREESIVTVSGLTADTVSDTVTKFYYDAAHFNETHYGYYDNYYKNYVGKLSASQPDENVAPDATALLAGGFGKVLGETGQTFNLQLNAGETVYNGKIFAKVDMAEISDIFNAIEIRAEIAKAGSNQDFYFELVNGELNAYYSNDFAVTANIAAIKTYFDGLSDKIESAKTAEENAADGGIDLNRLLSLFKVSKTDSGYIVSLEDDNLLGLNLGLSLSLNIKALSEGEYAFESASLKNISYAQTGINLSLSLTAGDDSRKPMRDKVQTAANLKDFIADVYSLLKSQTLCVNFNLNTENCLLLNNAGIDALQIGVNAYVSNTAINKNGESAILAANFNLTTLKNNKTYAANLGVWNDFTTDTVFISLKSINGDSVNVNISCDTSDVLPALKTVIGEYLGNINLEIGAEDIAEIVNVVLNMDLSKAITGLYANADKIGAIADIDYILSNFGVVEAGEKKFGTAAITYFLNVQSLNLDNPTGGALVISLDALGLDATIYGYGGTVPERNENDTFAHVQTYIENVKQLIDSDNLRIKLNIDASKSQLLSDAGFNNYFVDFDGIVSLSENNGKDTENAKKSVSLIYATASVYQKNEAGEITEGLTFKVNYDFAAKIAFLTVTSIDGNNVYVNVYCDIEETKATVYGIIDELNTLLGNKPENSVNASPAKAKVLNSVKTGANSEKQIDIISLVNGLLSIEFDKLIKGITADANGVSLLINMDYALEALGIFDLEDMGFEKVFGVAGVNYALKGEQEDAAGGALSLSLDGLGVSAYVYGSTQKVELPNKSDYTSLTDFIKNIDETAIFNILGENNVCIDVVLNGDESGIKQLAGVDVKAKLFFVQSADVAQSGVTTGKLAGAEIELNVSGTYAFIKAFYTNSNVYVTVNQVGNTVLTDAKFVASANDIESVVADIVALIKDTDLLRLVSGMFGGVPVIPNITDVKLPEIPTENVQQILSGILSFKYSDLKETLSLNTFGNGFVLNLNVDKLLELLGVEAGVEIGKANITYVNDTENSKKSVELSMQNANGDKWACVSAVSAAGANIAVGEDLTKYVDVGFISQLVSDLKNTAVHTDESGKQTINTLYTFKNGRLELKIIGILNVTLTDLTLTFGVDEYEEFYLTVTARATASLNAVKDTYVSLTYSRGYLTLGRDIYNSSVEYKVMTMEYFLDNLFLGDGVMKWWLQISNSIYNMILSAGDSLSFDSGLNTPDKWYLPEPETTLEEVSIFGQNGFIESFAINAGNKNYSYPSGATCGAVSNLGLSDNYYAFSLNTAAFTNLTNGAISETYAALLRDSANNCFSGVKLSAKLLGYMTVSMNLSEYVNGATVETGAAKNYYNVATANRNINFGYQNDNGGSTDIFGCYSTNGNSYNYQKKLNVYTVTVDMGNGKIYTANLKYGSTITVTDDGVYTVDGNGFVVYLDTKDNNKIVGSRIDGGIEITVTGDMYIVRGYSDMVDVSGVKLYNGDDVLGDLGSLFGDVAGENGFVYNGLPLPAVSDYNGVEGYKLIGWYTDSQLTQRATAVSFEIIESGALYGKFLKTEQIVNGVVYTFAPDGTGGGSFAVTGHTADIGSNVTLESEFYGYKVTSIAADALSGCGLKNVIVPENIVFVGERAFENNYGIETVAFKAEMVEFAGTVDGKSLPFYGCSVTDSSTNNANEKTALVVYYNNISTQSEGENWRHFRTVTKLFTYKFYIGENGGATYQHDEWAHVEYEITGDYTNDFGSIDCLKNGYTVSALSEEDIVTAVLDEINGKTAANYGYINGYKVSVSNGVELNGFITVTVTISEDTENSRYELSVSDDGNGTVGYEAETCEAYGKVFVKSGAVVTLLQNANGGYEFVGWNGNVEISIVEESYLFTMPANKVEISAEFAPVVVTTNTLYSTVQFTYQGKTANSVGEAVYSIDGIETGHTFTQPESVAEGYVFLGWTVEDSNGQLQFVSQTATEEVGKYYAVWTVAREDVQFNVSTSGNMPSANVVNGFEGSVYGWYSTSEFDNGTKLDNLTATATVVYIRLQYNLNFKWSGNLTSHYSVNGNIVDKNKSSFTYNVGVLENDKLEIRLNGSLGSATECLIISGENEYKITAKASIGGGTRYFKNSFNVSGIGGFVQDGNTYTLNSTSNFSVSTKF